MRKYKLSELVKAASEATTTPGLDRRRFFGGLASAGVAASTAAEAEARPELTTVQSQGRRLLIGNSAAVSWSGGAMESN